MSRAARFSFALLALFVAGAAMASPSDRNDNGRKRGRPAYVQWSPEFIRAAVDRGSTSTYTATFTSNVDLQNVSLRLTPSLGPFAALDVSSFATMQAHTPYTIHIALSIPPAPADSLLEARDSYNGLVQMRAAGHPLPSLLKLQFRVIAIDPIEDLEPAGGRRPHH